MGTKRPVLVDEVTDEVFGGNLTKNQVTAADPTASNDSTQGYGVGSRWTNSLTGITFIVTDVTAGAAVWNAVAGAGDMQKSTYDPTNVNGDAFAMDNMVEGTTNKILTATERTNIANNTTDSHTHANKAQLDLVTDGDHDVRTDNPHGTGGANLLSTGQPVGKILQTDGSNGFTYVDPPTGGGSAAGSDRDVQLNNAGAFGAIESDPDDNFVVGSDVGLKITRKVVGGYDVGGQIQAEAGHGGLAFGARLQGSTYGSGNQRLGVAGAKGCLNFGVFNNRSTSSPEIRTKTGNGGAHSEGSIAGGSCRTPNAYYGSYRNTKILAYGSGCVAMGEAFCDSTPNPAYIKVGTDYNFARACMAFGYAKNAEIKAYGKGSVAMGNTEAGYGNSDIFANGNGCFMFNAGTNNLANSVKFGGGGYSGFPHIRGGAGYSDPSGIADGQIWCVYDYFYGGHEMKARVDGVTKLFSLI